MKGALVWMLLGLLARVVLAGSLELGNDEAYYALYAAHLDWSYFDHPGMVGWLTKPFAGGSDWGMRMVPLICGTLNGFLLFALGKAHGGIRVGTAAVALYTASFYGSVIAGVFLMPDAPQSTFWLAALLIATRNLTGQNRPTFLTWTGLGMSLAGALLSKYHSAFLVLGIGAYCAMHRRELLASFGFWWMNVLACCGLLPTIWWNHLNDWISFAFHGNRVNPDQGVRLDFLAQELVGECAYQNPVVWFLTWAGVFFALKRAGERWRTQPIALALWIALPLLATFIGFSLFRHTLPHWTGPAYLTLLPVAATMAVHWGRLGRRLLFVAAGMFVAVMTMGLAQIQTGCFTPNADLADAPNDVTLDLYGWSQAGDLWSQFVASEGLDAEQAVICSPGWFPSAHLQRYLASRTGSRVWALGDVQAVHHFAWIQARAGFPSVDSRFLLVTDSRNLARAEAWRAKHAPMTTWRSLGRITRRGKAVKELWLTEIPRFPPPSYHPERCDAKNQHHAWARPH